MDGTYEYIQLIILVVIAIISIIGLAKLFAGETVLETQAEIGKYALSIKKTGFYSLWLGKTFAVPSLKDRHVVILDLNSHKKSAFRVFGRIESSSFKTKSSQIKYFYLKKGEYQFIIEHPKEQSVNLLDGAFSDLVSVTEKTNYSYKLKHTLPQFLFPLFALGIGYSIMRISNLIMN